MNSKIFVMLANGFELVEALAPVDVLRRAGLNVVTVSTVENSLEVESAIKVKVKADININDVKPEEGVMVVIPGGNPGYINLRENSKVIEIVKHFVNANEKYVGAICGGPTVLGVNGLIGDHKYTCHTSVKFEMPKAENYQHSAVVVDGKLITSIGAGRAIDFGFELARIFVDEEKITAVKKAMELI